MKFNNRQISNQFRVFHRYLGFFLAGIMAVYAISGIVLTFRNTDYMKSEVAVSRTLPTGLEAEELGAELRRRGFEVQRTEGDLLFFEGGTYNKATGEAEYTEKRLPVVLEKMNNLHKMHSGNPLFWLGIFFGVALLFFSISAFWMFMPGAPIFKKGLYFAGAGFLLTVILLFV
ncbi:PepSY-associated TM helix domain-containing protein [Robiginitalea sp. SC105]|uniref:PepSY-associated TM helix domain-containing protein n=1 Tax=Robiginitalea sp. SC105 TaxID=2762332 RepID=UPI00163B557F|nr:PepSY-associated TM helix domain-containing protein [Robiginitalea sp. SC105]MBC2838464.1 PepSY-associated TM helix domain-containing protein [Robiginitalea sp. SC105]